MTRNKKDFAEGYQGPARRVFVKGTEETGGGFVFDVHPEAGTKSIGKHIARATKSLGIKPAKVSFNKDNDYE